MTQKVVKKSGSKRTTKRAAKSGSKTGKKWVVDQSDPPAEAVRQEFVQDGRLAGPVLDPQTQQLVLQRLEEQYPTVGPVYVDDHGRELLFISDEVAARMAPVDPEALGRMIDRSAVEISELLDNLPLARQDLSVLRGRRIGRQQLDQYVSQVEQASRRLIELRNALATYRA